MFQSTHIVVIQNDIMEEKWLVVCVSSSLMFMRVVITQVMQRRCLNVKVSDIGWQEGDDEILRDGKVDYIGFSYYMSTVVKHDNVPVSKIISLMVAYLIQ